MTSFADLNMATFDPDNFFPPADTSTSTNGLVQPLQPTTSNLPAVQIDEEVILKHKRRKQLKISDQLLIDRGLPHLRSEAHRQLKFKGKGYEKQDLSKLLSYYQLWLHDIFPKAKFRDCIKMAMQSGNSKHFKEMRKEWIEGRKEKPPVEISAEEMEVLHELERQDREDREREETQEDREREVQEEIENGNEEGEKGDEPLFVEDFSDIDMDEVLREKERTEKPSNGEYEEFDDDMEALREMGL